MPELYYKEALKLGQKEAKAAAARGESAALPSLDELLADKRTVGEIDLGVIHIPADHIVGTKTRGRGSAFAPNFMPVMEEGSEFADKWEHLCQAHLEEGIRDAVKAYEYLNRFYIEEGNKRVSVLKYFDAIEISAHVIRILPERDGSDEIELYYEFTDFYKSSKINFIDFTKKGSYTALMNILGKDPDVEWTVDEQKEFSAAYYYFRKAYLSSGGAKLSSTCGDAMLSYMKVYGYNELIETDPDDIKKNLNRMWEEVALHEEETPIELQLDPAEEKQPSLIAKVLSPATPTVLKVGFLYDGTPETSGWVNDHEQGRMHIQQVYQDKIETKVYLRAMDVDPLMVIEQAIDEGCALIFTTSPRFLQASLRAAVDHPGTVIMNCSLNTSHRYLRSYYTRMYEAKFILGALAGTLTESGKLGYVCDYPIYGQIAAINAFALGAQMVNPRSRVYLEWSATKGAADAAAALKEKDIHFISSQDTSRFRYDNRSSFGLSYLRGDERRLLANPVWRWGVYYEEILRRYFNKTMQAEYEKSNKALNYYWGMSAGVVDVMYTDALSTSSKNFGNLLKESIRNNICTPFLTPLITQSGEMIGEGEKNLSLEQIINMDYLVENVIGSIPQYDELTPMGKATVDMAGIEKAQNTLTPDESAPAPSDSSREAQS